MLTTEDRRWLTGEKSYTGAHAKQQRYQRRRDIRERVYNSLLDFSILFEHLETRERRKLFGSDTDAGDGIAQDAELANGVRDALAFLLSSAGMEQLMQSPTPPDCTANWLLREAIHRAGIRDGYFVHEIDLTIDAERLPRESILADLEAGEALSPGEIRVLLESDAVDRSKVQECLRREIFDE